MHEQIEKLYLQYYYDLYSFLFKICPDANLIDDVIQTAFLEAFKTIENFKAESSLKTWLFAIARNQLYRTLRKHKKTVQLDQLPEAELSEKPDWSDRILAKEIMDNIENLTPPLNEIMRLRLVFGLSFREIGERVQRSENYCRVNFYRIKQRLRKEYEHEEM